MAGAVETDGVARFRGSVMTPSLGYAWWAEIEIAPGAIRIRQRFLPWSRWRTVHPTDRVDLRRVNRVGLAGIGFVRGGELRGWMFWNFRMTEVLDALTAAGWSVGPPLTMDDLRGQAW